MESLYGLHHLHILSPIILIIKGFFGIILLTAVNANYLVIRKNGHNSYRSVIEHTELYQHLRNGTPNLPTCNDTVRRFGL